MIELDTVAAFDHHVASVGTLDGVVLHGLDLSARTEELVRLPLGTTVLLGCVMESDALRRLHAHGALVFPPLPDLPFRAFRGALYTAEELYEGYVRGDASTLESALDTRTYRWSVGARERGTIMDTLAQRIHDHAIEDALADLLDAGDLRRRVVAIMGGHAMRRDEARYLDVARLARTLTRAGLVCASGGGPGAMEATNLGAWLAPHPDAALDEAVALLAAVPGIEDASAWLDRAWDVRQRWPRPAGEGESLGVPTWHYGHEPPNVFATHVAKYFANSIREDGLLAIAVAGVVFAPGSAGTVQEVFQDAAQNHYRSLGTVSPMVFVDTHYWTTEKPVYPLLQRLAAGHEYGALVSIHDDVDAVAALLVARRE